MENKQVVWPSENGRCALQKVVQVRQDLSRRERKEVGKRVQKGEKVYL